MATFYNNLKRSLYAGTTKKPVGTYDPTGFFLLLFARQHQDLALPVLIIL